MSFGGKGTEIEIAMTGVGAGEGGRAVAAANEAVEAKVCCSCTAACTSSSDGSSARLARAVRTFSGRVHRKMALKSSSLLGV